MADEKQRITRKDLATNIQKNVGLPYVKSYEIVNFLLDTIKDKAINEGVRLRGLGTLTKVEKRERLARNPKTGKPAIVSKRSILRFKVARSFKDELQGKLES